MMRSLRVLSRMLDYPQAALQTHADELVDALRSEAVFSGATTKALVHCMETLRDGDLYDLQAGFVDTFDRGRARSLYLFEHVHGESRDRGQAMVDLGTSYRTSGLRIDQRELPDYLPLFLEFLSTLPAQEANEWLQAVAELVAHLHARLCAKASPYAAVLAAVLELTGQSVDTTLANEAMDDDQPEALDAAWEEPLVEFGSPATGCAQANESAGARPLKITRGQRRM